MTDHSDLWYWQIFLDTKVAETIDEIDKWPRLLLKGIRCIGHVCGSRIMQEQTCRALGSYVEGGLSKV